MKSRESIFKGSELRHSIVRAIYYEDLEAFPSLKTYKDWLEPFFQNYEKIKDDHTVHGVKNSRSLIFNFIRQSDDSPQQFFKKLFTMIDDLESRNLIGSSEEFIGEMLAWMLDPVRFVYVDNKKIDALKSVNSILDRRHKIIRYNETLRRYVFETKLATAPIDKDAIFFYGDKIFITNGLLKHKRDNDNFEIVKTTPTDIKVLTILISMGKGNINHWLKKQELSSKLNIESGTLSNSLTSLRRISKIVGIDLLEDRGSDTKGKEFRINPKVL